MKRTSFLASILLSLSFASVASAQPRYARRGYYTAPPTTVTVAPREWYMGVGAFGTSILDQSGGPERINSGGGISVWAGINLNPVLSLELGWLGSFHNPITYYDDFGRTTDYLVLQGVTGDAKIHLPHSGRLDPYFQGGVGVYVLGSSFGGADSVGTGFQLGGGFDYWVNPLVTVGVRARYHGIAMGPGDGAQNDTYISAATVEGSVSFHF